MRLVAFGACCAVERLSREARTSSMTTFVPIPAAGPGTGAVAIRIAAADGIAPDDATITRASAIAARADCRRNEELDELPPTSPHFGKSCAPSERASTNKASCIQRLNSRFNPDMTQDNRGVKSGDHAYAHDEAYD